DTVAARGSLRFSLGHTTTSADIARVGEVIGPVVARARAAGIVGVRRSARVRMTSDVDPVDQIEV
ncbi:MAG TPA: hypothetical protein VF892_21800, partial [Pseudonocardiaceae bacterium]